MGRLMELCMIMMSRYLQSTGSVALNAVLYLEVTCEYGYAAGNRVFFSYSFSPPHASQDCVSTVLWENVGAYNLRIGTSTMFKTPQFISNSS